MKANDRNDGERDTPDMRPGDRPGPAHGPREQPGDPPPPATPAPHDCRACTITRIVPFPAFPPGSTTLRLPVSVDTTPTLTLTAEPSDPDCPCEWRNTFQIAGHRIATGHANLPRETLNAGPSPMIETLRPRLSRLTPLFALTGCRLRIRLQDLDRRLRAGIGLANRVVMIEIGLQVRCAPRGRWRNIRIAVDD